jgi:hypothetical protein
MERVSSPDYKHAHCQKRQVFRQILNAIVQYYHETTENCSQRYAACGILPQRERLSPDASRCCHSFTPEQNQPLKIQKEVLQMQPGLFVQKPEGEDEVLSNDDTVV